MRRTKRLRALLLGAALVSLAPISAEAFTVTKVNSTTNWNHASSVHSVTLTTNVAVPANDYLVVGILARTAVAGDTIVVSNNVDGTITGAQVIDCPVGTANGHSAIAYIKTAGLPSGSTITIADTSTGGTLFTEGQLSAYGINGIDGTTPLDSGATTGACNANTGSATTETVTSGTPTYANSLLFGQLATMGTSGTPTEDAAWTTQTVTGDSNGTIWGATFVETGAVAKNRTTTTTTGRPYASLIVGFKATGAPLGASNKLMFQSVP